MGLCRTQKGTTCDTHGMRVTEMLLMTLKN